MYVVFLVYSAQMKVRCLTHHVGLTRWVVWFGQNKFLRIAISYRPIFYTPAFSVVECYGRPDTVCFNYISASTVTNQPRVNTKQSYVHVYMLLIAAEKPFNWSDWWGEWKCGTWKCGTKWQGYKML